MKAALINSTLGLALGVLTPAMRLLRMQPSSKVSDAEYFAAARKRAIEFRLAKAASRTAVAGAKNNE